MSMCVTKVSLFLKKSLIHVYQGLDINVVPTAGFEPATYRLRSDCSAVEPSRRAHNIDFIRS